MGNVVRSTTTIAAPVGRCFDLARSIDFHIDSARSSQEQAVGGVTTGLITLGQEVEWKAKHFSIWFNLRTRITEFIRPVFFQDSIVHGPFRSFCHDHVFKWTGTETVMTDELHFRLPAVAFWLEKLVADHFDRFLQERNLLMKTALESDQWRQYLPSHEM